MYGADLNFAFAHTRRINFGAGALNDIGTLAGELGGRRAVVVTDSFLAEKTDYLERAKKSLGPRFAGAFTGVVPDPTAESIDKGAEEVRRGNVRDPFISVENPAQGRFSALAIKLIGKCARSRGMDSRFPEALRALKGSVSGYFIFEPVERYDQADPSQIPIHWY